MQTVRIKPCRNISKLLLQIDELKAMSSPPRERGKNYWLTADIDALNGLTEALSEAVCVEQHLDGKVLHNQF